MTLHAIILISSIAFYLVFGLLLTPLAWVLYEDRGLEASPWRKLNARFEKARPRSFRLYVALFWPLVCVVTILAWVFVELPMAIALYIMYGHGGKPTAQPTQQLPSAAPTASISSKRAEGIKAIGVAASLALLFGAKIMAKKRT